MSKQHPPVELFGSASKSFACKYLQTININEILTKFRLVSKRMLIWSVFVFVPESFQFRNGNNVFLMIIIAIDRDGAWRLLFCNHYKELHALIISFSLCVKRCLLIQLFATHNCRFCASAQERERENDNDLSCSSLLTMTKEASVLGSVSPLHHSPNYNEDTRKNVLSSAGKIIPPRAG